MTEDVFDTQTPQTDTDPLAELVGEGKKFKDTSALAKAKVEADAFIERLKAENVEMRKEVGAVDNAERQLAELRAEITALKAKPAQSNREGNTTPALTESDVAALVQREITNLEASRSAAQNIKEANTKAMEIFGSTEKATEAVRARASELGLTVDFLKTVASQSPSAFLSMIRAGSPEQVVKNARHITGTVNTESPGTQSASTLKPGTKEFFDNMRRTDKKRYWSPDVQNKMIPEAVAAGTYQLRKD